MFDNNIEIHKAFWNRKNIGRPLLGINVGFTLEQRFPNLVKAISPGPLQPNDIPLDAFLEDCDRLYNIHQGLGDYPFTSAPFVGVPWMEAIMGCPIHASKSSIWAETCIDDWADFEWEKPTLENSWTTKLLELTASLVKHSDGRYPVAPTLMRGPSDIISAMRGAGNFPIDLMDHPDVIKRLAKMCAEVHLETGNGQLSLIPDSENGYFAGDAALRVWSPEKIVWLQEDAMSLLSPSLYSEFFLPLDKWLASEYPCSVFHLHGSALWAIDELVQTADINVIELNLEDASCDIEGTFAGWKKIQKHKPLIIWRMYGDDFESWLQRVSSEIPLNGVSIQVSTNNKEEAEKIKEVFLRQFPQSDSF